MPFDLEGARQTGASDQEILSFLAESKQFDLEGAKQAGASDQELITFLSEQERPEPSKQPTAPTPEQPQIPQGFEALQETGLIPERLAPVQLTPEQMEFAGGAAGGIIGFSLTGTPVGSSLGSILLASAGKQIGRLVTDTQPETPADIALVAIDDVYEATKGEALGLVTAKGLGAIPKIFTQKGRLDLIETVAGEAENIGLKPGKKITEKIEFLRGLEQEKLSRALAAEELGIRLTPAEATGGTLFGKTEDILKKFFTKQFSKFEQKQFAKLLEQREKLVNDVYTGAAKDIDAEKLGLDIQTQINKMLKDRVTTNDLILNRMRNSVLKVFGSDETYENLGKTGKQLIEQRGKELQRVATKFYNKAAESLPNKLESEIPIENFRKTVNEIIEHEAKILPGLRERADIMDRFKSLQRSLTPQEAPPVESAILGPSGLPAQITPGKISQKTSMTLAEINKTRPAINKIIDDVSTFLGEETIKKGTKKAIPFFKLKEALDNDVAAYAKSVGGKAEELLKKGIQYSKRRFDFFDTSVIKKALAAEDDDVLKILIDKPGRVSFIKKELGEKALNKFAKKRIQEIFDTGETFDPNQALKNFNKYGDDYMTRLIGKSGVDDIKNVINSGITRKTGAQMPRVLYGRTFLKTLQDSKTPAKFSDVVFRKDNAQNVRRVFKAMTARGRKDIIDDLQATLIEKILPIDSVTETISPRGTIKALEESIGKATLNEALSMPQRNSIDAFEKVLRAKAVKDVGKSDISVIMRAISFFTELPPLNFIAKAYLYPNVTKRLTKTISVTPTLDHPSVLKEIGRAAAIILRKDNENQQEKIQQQIKE